MANQYQFIRAQVQGNGGGEVALSPARARKVIAAPVWSIGAAILWGRGAAGRGNSAARISTDQRNRFIEQMVLSITSILKIR